MTRNPLDGFVGSELGDRIWVGSTFGTGGLHRTSYRIDAAKIVKSVRGTIRIRAGCGDRPTQRRRLYCERLRHARETS